MVLVAILLGSLVSVGAGFDCACRDTQEPVWNWLRDAAGQVKSEDPNLRGANVGEICRVTYPYVARSFYVNETVDAFVVQNDCPIGVSTAALFCAQAAALRGNHEERSSVLNLLYVALRSWESVPTSCSESEGKAWPFSLVEVRTQFGLMLENKEAWKYLQTEYSVDAEQQLFNIRWTRGIDSETDYWRPKFTASETESAEDWQLMQTWTSNSSAVFWYHDSPCEHAKPENPHRVVRVLNAGSGPFVPERLTCANLPNPVALYNADGLGRYYLAMHAQYVPDQVMPPVFSCIVEEMYRCFPENFFDVAQMVNALDHVYDPLAGLNQLLFVTKKGGKIVLRHGENEGWPGGFRYGLHQWGFTINEHGDFIIWNPQRVVNVNEQLKGVAAISARRIPHPKPHFLQHPSFKHLVFVDITKL